MHKLLHKTVLLIFTHDALVHLHEGGGQRRVLDLYFIRRRPLWKPSAMQNEGGLALLSYYDNSIQLSGS